MRRLVFLLLAPLLTACGDSTGPVSTEDVGGVYQVCSLVFTPGGGTLPAVNVRAVVMDTASTSPNPPRLTLSTQVRDFELAYTPRNDVLVRRPGGSYEAGRNTVTLAFTDPALVASTLLLPARLRLEVQVSPKALQASDTQDVHRVARADYARLAGISQTNLPTEIEGSVSGRFVITGSPCS
jgi:hypothetical protein